jgi:hypothetical protein
VPAGPLVSSMDSLFRVTWTPVSTAASTEQDVTVVDVVGGDVRSQVQRVLGELQTWLAEHSADTARLLFRTRGAVGAEVTDLAGAAVWGLVRSAQSENPDRFVLVDGDPEDVPLALAAQESQVLVRDGVVLAPRLTHAPTPTEPLWSFDSTSTVLITGAFGMLGKLFARHLVTEHGVRRLVLLSRSVGDTSELSELGVDVVTVACDVSDREALAGWLNTR